MNVAIKGGKNKNYEEEKMELVTLKEINQAELFYGHLRFDLDQF